MNYTKIMAAVIMLAALGLFLLAGSAFAGTATVTWTNPTTRTDGSALTGAISTRVEWGTCNGTAFGSAVGEKTATGTSTTVTLPAGSYCFRAFTRDSSNVESAASNVLAKLVPVAPPNPPTLVTISTVAYEMKLFPNGFWHLAMNGSVELGVPCTPVATDTATQWLGIVDGKFAICGRG